MTRGLDPAKSKIGLVAIVLPLLRMCQFWSAVSDEINVLIWEHPTQHFLESNSAAGQPMALPQRIRVRADALLRPGGCIPEVIINIGDQSHTFAA